MTYRPHLIAVLLASAGVHAALTPEHLDEAPMLGWLFLASVVVAVALAGAVLVVPSRQILLAAAAVLLTFAAAYAYTRLTGLEALGIPHEEPDRLGLATVALELAGVGFALSASRRAWPVLRPAR